MIHHPAGDIEYDARGEGATVVLVPGSFSTGAAWRPVVAALGDGYRTVTTSLAGYGATVERRTDAGSGMQHEVEIVEAVLQRAALDAGGAAVHLVGHSFGGLVAIEVARRRRIPVASLAIFEAPAVTLLAEAPAEAVHEHAFKALAERYFAAHAAGDPDAVAMLVDFYGGPGTFAAWPERARSYAAATVAVNIRDWAAAYATPLSAADLAGIMVPRLVAWGGASHPAAKRANELLAAGLAATKAGPIAGATHFMIATHPAEVAVLIAGLVRAAR